MRFLLVRVSLPEKLDFENSRHAHLFPAKRTKLDSLKRHFLYFETVLNYIK